MRRGHGNLPTLKRRHKYKLQAANDIGAIARALAEPHAGNAATASNRAERLVAELALHASRCRAPTQMRNSTNSDPHFPS